MSSYICETCGLPIINTETGFITGCNHHPLGISDAFIYRCSGCGIHFLNSKDILYVKEHVIELCKYCKKEGV